MLQLELRSVPEEEEGGGQNAGNVGMQEPAAGAAEGEEASGSGAGVGGPSSVALGKRPAVESPAGQEPARKNPRLDRVSDTGVPSVWASPEVESARAAAERLSDGRSLLDLVGGWGEEDDDEPKATSNSAVPAAERSRRDQMIRLCGEILALGPSTKKEDGAWVSSNWAIMRQAAAGTLEAFEVFDQAQAYQTSAKEPEEPEE